MMHLTNYAINKKSPDFVFNTSDKEDNIGHKRSYSSVMEHLRRIGVDVESMQSAIDQIVVKTVLAGLPSMNEVYRRAREGKEVTSVCFEILGFDIMIDEDLKPYLIEVNHTPSFTTDTPLDFTIKKNLLLDTLNIIRVDEEGKRDFLSGKTSPIDKLAPESYLR